MKRKTITLLLAVMTGSMALAGCGKGTETETEKTVAEEKPVETEVTPEENQTAKGDENPVTDNTLGETPEDTPEEGPNGVMPGDPTMFMELLEGNAKVAVGEELTERSYDAIPAGEYTLEEIKPILEDGNQVENASIYYTILETEEDTLCLVRFASAKDSYLGLNWTAVISASEGKYTLSDFYTDGYRTYATLYDNGTLLTGGSCSAGEFLDEVCVIESPGYVVPYRSVINVTGAWISDDVTYQTPFPDKLEEITQDANSPYDITALNDSDYTVCFCTSGDDQLVVIVGYEEGKDEAADTFCKTLQYLGFRMAGDSLVEEYKSYRQDNCSEVEWREL